MYSTSIVLPAKFKTISENGELYEIYPMNEWLVLLGVFISYGTYSTKYNCLGSYKVISIAIKIAESTAVAEMASTPEDFKIENFLTLTS